MSFWPSSSENKLASSLLTILLIILIFFFGFKTIQVVKENQFIGKSDTAQHTVQIDGIGTISAKPDIAVLTFGLSAEDKSVSKAQEINTEGMNAIIKAVKEARIDEKDLQTIDYSAYEKKDWDPGTRTYKSNGWIVSQSLRVKVRDVKKVSGVIDAVVKTGVTSVSGPNFQIDEADKLEEEARELALKDAKKKAEKIAKELGVKIKKVIGYTEYKQGRGPIYSYDAISLGAEKSSAPDIEIGENDVVIHVSVTYLLSD